MVSVWGIVFSVSFTGSSQKGQRQDIEEEREWKREKGEGERGRGGRSIHPGKERTASGPRGAAVAHRKMAGHKGRGGAHTRGRCFIFTGHVN